MGTVGEEKGMLEKSVKEIGRARVNSEGRGKGEGERVNGEETEGDSWRNGEKERKLGKVGKRESK